MFNFEKWLQEHSYWEDPDSVLIFSSTEDGGVMITSFDGDISADGKTLEEACTNFSKQVSKQVNK